jgi:hypothetical protein
LLRRVFSAVMLVFVFVGLMFFVFSIERVEAVTVTVPDNYLTIGEAISHCDVGDTIVVKNGTYDEELTLEKSLTLFGNNKLDTVVEGLNVSGFADVYLTNLCVNHLDVENSSSVWAVGCRFPEAYVGCDGRLLISQSEAWDVHTYGGGEVLGFYDLPLFGRVVFSLPFGFILYILPILAVCVVAGTLVFFYFSRRKRKSVSVKQ